MFNVRARCALILFALLALLPAASAAEPIKLKLSYYTSDTEVFYRTAVKPFVDSVNTVVYYVLGPTVSYRHTCHVTSTRTTCITANSQSKPHVRPQGIPPMGR